VCTQPPTSPNTPNTPSPLPPLTSPYFAPRALCRQVTLQTSTLRTLGSSKHFSVKYGPGTGSSGPTGGGDTDNRTFTMQSMSLESVTPSQPDVPRPLHASHHHPLPISPAPAPAPAKQFERRWAVSDPSTGVRTGEHVAGASDVSRVRRMARSASMADTRQGPGPSPRRGRGRTPTTANTILADFRANKIKGNLRSAQSASASDRVRRAAVDEEVLSPTDIPSPVSTTTDARNPGSSTPLIYRSPSPLTRHGRRATASDVYLGV
jgi:hypothetical protein